MPKYDEPLPLIHWRPDRTPIVADMQTTARELGIIQLLLEAQIHREHYPGHSLDCVNEALARLGATETERRRACGELFLVLPAAEGEP